MDTVYDIKIAHMVNEFNEAGVNVMTLHPFFRRKSLTLEEQMTQCINNRDDNGFLSYCHQWRDIFLKV